MVENWRSELDMEKSQAKYSGNKAFWLYGESSGGRLIILGPYCNEQEADIDGCKRFTEDFEILGLTNRRGMPLLDKNTVTQIIKKRRMDEQNLALDEATRYARHYSKEQ